jgi:hypothetical protein
MMMMMMTMMMMMMMMTVQASTGHHGGDLGVPARVGAADPVHPREGARLRGARQAGPARAFAVVVRRPPSAVRRPSSVVRRPSSFGVVGESEYCTNQTEKNKSFAPFTGKRTAPVT